MEDKLGEFGFHFFKSFLKESRDNVKNYLVKYQVGFLPKGMDYSDFKKLKEKTIFKQLEFLIGNHSTLKIILTGLYISSLNKETRKNVIEENRQKIYDKYKSKGVSIMNMATTGFIEYYVKWLTKYNVEKNPSQQELIDFYEKILEDWKERSVFIQTFMSLEIVKNKIVGKMSLDKDVFFVFASCNVIKIVEESIDSIDVNGYGYNFYSEKLHNNYDEIVWIFEKIK